MFKQLNPILPVKEILKEINGLADEMAGLSNLELKNKTQEFKERLAQGESLDDLLPEAFAVVREADKRVLGMFPYDVQVMGGIVMHQGHIAEMNTGEGKTLTATMPVYLNALSGEGAILVTTNEYLAIRDAEEMGQVYEFLGLTIGVPCVEGSNEMDPAEKRAIYQSDIVYTTNASLGFDYLIDNLASNQDGKYMRPFNYAIVDEVDSVLLDSAQTPLIISGAPRVQSNYYGMMDTLMTTLVEGEDYIFKEEKGEVWLTTKGAKAAENYLGIGNLYDEENSTFARHLLFSLRAHLLYKKDKDYIIRDGKKGPEVVLLDKSTGRLLELTKLQGGLHQAIEAKELVALSQETRAMASITYQSLFKKFKKISGMTGTGKVAEKEFLDTYGMKVIQIPTNRKKQRIDYPDKIYATLPEKVFASLEYVKHYHEKGNPILIFVGSVEMSELYSSLLLREGIAHNLLNANNAPREAEMIAESGQMGAVTVASTFARHLLFSLRAHLLYKKDKDYIIRDGKKGPEVVLLDKSTGRLLELTKLQGGLHQAIEAKELVALSQETRAMASITYQSLFKKFKKISGMTGTGKVAEKEFLDTYGMKVIQIPTNRKKQRIDYPDKIYATLPEKVFASLEYVKHYHEKGNPILIFVGSVEMSELYSSLLLREGIAHNLLNANNAPREAEMIAESGQMGAVTVATSMAGRGTDIKLGKGVAELGGLVVIGTERMESQRIDLQIRGRSGRQGDPGMSKFFVSLEDDVIKKYGPSWVHRTYKEYAINDHIEPKELTGRKYRKLVEKAQEASESSGRTSRRQTLEFAESMNIQREMIYAQRDRLIYHNQGLDTVIDEVLDDFIDQAMAEEDFSKAENLYHFILRNISFRINEIPKDLDLNNREQVLELIYQFAYRELDAKKQELKTKELNEYFQRLSMLKAVDDNWVEQVDYLQQLQMAIGSQQLSQKNPIVEYYQEAYKGFEAMKRQIRKDMVRNLLLSQVQVTKKGDIISHFP
jgi:preprotein translocase subunit SecA